MNGVAGTITRRGVPTGPDVAKLISAYPTLSEGTFIPYEAIEKVLGMKRTEHRYKTVFKKWRDKLEVEQNIVLEIARGVGFKAATPKERVGISSSKVKTGVQFIRKGSAIAASTDRTRLSKEDQRICDHFAKVSSAIEGATRVAPKGIKYLSE